MPPRSARLLTMLLALASGDCTSVVWYGHSPDRRQQVQVLERCGKQRVKRANAVGRGYLGVGVDALIFSPDSRRLAYPAQKQDRTWVVVLDGQEGAAWDGIGEIAFSPDSRHLAYLAQRGHAWHVVQDGQPGPALDGVQRGSLQFSPDSQHLLLVALGQGQARVVLDGRQGPPFDRVDRLTTGPGGKPAYVGIGPEQARVVIGAETGPPYDEISELVLGPSGRKFAYSARQGQRWLVLLDGQPATDHDHGKPSSLCFTSDGKLLYVARRGEQKRVVFDAKKGPVLDEVQPPVCGKRGRWGYIGRRGEQHLLVLNGVETKVQGVASSLVLGPGGRRHAYLEHHGRKVQVVHDRGRHSFDLVLSGTLVFSADGQHLGFIAGDRSRRELFLAIGDRRGPRFDLEEFNAALMLRPNQAREWLRAWVRAELTRALAGRLK